MTSFNIPKNVINRVTYMSYRALRDIAISSNGTIFGGFVRDEIIADYYREKFIEKMGKGNLYTQEEFWNTNIYPETKYRTLCPQDIDISFSTDEDVETFINSVKKYYQFKNAKISLANNSNTYLPVEKNAPVISSFKRLFIMFEIGVIPFVSNGVSIIITADIVRPCLSHFAPPFGNLDMLCNGFIITPSNELMFSKNTGTFLDNSSIIIRTNAIAQILNDIKNFKTVVCFNNNGLCTSFLNVHALNRIQKMHRKNLGWKFFNMPYETDKFIQSKHKDNKCNDCMICLQEVKNMQAIARVNTTTSFGEKLNGPNMHFKCFIKYLSMQSKSLKKKNNDKNYSFKCPLRNEVNFANCKLTLQNYF